jgi:hypothetical protein
VLFENLEEIPSGRCDEHLQKGGIPLLGIFFLSLDRQRGVRGDFRKNMSSQLWTP